DAMDAAGHLERRVGGEREAPREAGLGVVADAAVDVAVAAEREVVGIPLDVDERAAAPHDEMPAPAVRFRRGAAEEAGPSRIEPGALAIPDASRRGADELPRDILHR